MMDRRLEAHWATLPPGAQAALTMQWTGLAAGGLPCGAAIVDEHGHVVTVGRNHAYDHLPPVDVQTAEPLRFTRLAHAELNAIARVPASRDHASLTIWSTQHPCAMCAAAIAFTGIGCVHYIADDLSDDTPLRERDAGRSGVPYLALNDPVWWIVSNLSFVYGPVAMQGTQTRNLVTCRERAPRLAALVEMLAANDELGQHARAGRDLIEALAPHQDAVCQAAWEIAGEIKNRPEANGSTGG